MILPDVLKPGLAVVICGTAVGDQSAQDGAYYARAGNQFWPTLARVGLTPRVLRPEEYATLPQYGLGLTDLAKRVSGCDARLADGDFDRAGLRAKIEQFRPAVLAFHGKRAAEEFLARRVAEYGTVPETIGATGLFVLPSTSGMARRHWSLAPWEELAAFVAGRPPGPTS